MKKMILIMLAISVGMVSCKKETQEEEHTTPYDNLAPQKQSWGFCIDYTGSWCYYCGQWGNAALDNAVNVGNTVGMAVKVSPDPEAVATDLYNSFIADRPLNGGTPTLAAGDVTDADYNAASYCQQLVEKPCMIGIDARQEINNGQLSVYVKTKNFAAIPDISDYFIVAYLLEDGLHYEQTGSSSSDPVHNFVLRKASSGSVYYGESLMTDGAQDAEFTHTFSFDVTPYNASNCYAAIVIYKKSNGVVKHSYVNSFWTRGQH
ncbi:MAG: Omp28-related outer membrane protein [Bacteroidales bacterium]|nr:Omp28-related outer membrane protein [Bacteroidales bacterium]